MNILCLLPWRKTPARRARRAADVIDERQCQDEDRAPGCGWFNSSHDLQHGLQVREHLGADASGRELPLSLWLEIELQRRAPRVPA